MAQMSRCRVVALSRCRVVALSRCRVVGVAGGRCAVPRRRVCLLGLYHEVSLDLHCDRPSRVVRESVTHLGRQPCTRSLASSWWAEECLTTVYGPHGPEPHDVNLEGLGTGWRRLLSVT